MAVRGEAVTEQSVKQDNAMNLTPEHLAAIAERLGEPYVVHSYFDFDLRERKRAIARETPAVLGDESGHPVVLSPGDLLLAMLNRAVEMRGVLVDLGYSRFDKAWYCNFGPASEEHCGRSAVEAVALAFIQLPLDSPPSGKLPSPSV
jgi:hypothetical protein